MKTKKLGMAAALFTLLALAGCREKIIIPAEELTRDGYFTLRESNEKGRYGPVVIFPERHNSRLIQAEIGWALNVLLENCGINSIALEGMYEGETMTGNKLTYNSDKEKYLALLAILEKGDIKAPEFMYFAKDSFVFGIEDEAEYGVNIPDGAYMAFFQALLVSIVVDQGVEVLEAYLKTEEENEEKGPDFDALFALNPWTFETYKIVTKGRSLTATNGRLSELEKKTENFLDAETKTAFRQYRKYNDTTLQRSFTMAANVHDRLRNKNEPLAMIIGAAHTEDVVSYFDKNNVTYYVMEPSGLDAEGIWSDLTTDEFERRSEGMTVFENEEIGNFFDGAHNPRPTHAKYWVRQQFNFNALIGNVVSFISSPPPHNYSSLNNIEIGELRVVQIFTEISTESDFKFSVQNSRGETIYVRAVKNAQDYMFANEFVNFNKALRDMIVRLSQIDAQNMPYEQRVKVFEGVIEAFSYLNYTVFISPQMELLFRLDISQI